MLSGWATYQCDYIQLLRSQANKYQYDSFLDEALIDQLFLGISGNSLRERFIIYREGDIRGCSQDRIASHEMMEKDSNELSVR